MVTKKEWSEFKDTGLVLLANQILHVFGWAIVFMMDDDKIVDVYPARVKFRGFDNKSVSNSYKKVTRYVKKKYRRIIARSRTGLTHLYCKFFSNLQFRPCF